MRTSILAAISIFFTLVATPTHAQKQYNVWYFGGGAGVDFNVDPPKAITGPLTNVLEGLATIANSKTGELLFSTDGSLVLDKNGTQMPNGFGLLGGSGTSTQGAMILPFPLDTNRYYVFTADQAGYMAPNVGVHYSIVDMRLNGGLGDVIEKNVLLFGPTMAEKLTAVRHTNGCDVWIISHSGATNEYKAALLRDSAIAPIKVISPVGIAPQDHPRQYYENIGELVASNDGTKLVYLASNGFVELVDFDASTGKVSNALRLVSNGDAFYGACFSPEGSKLYVASYDPINIRQFDLTLPANQIPGSFRIVTTASGYNIKPGPDGNLYAMTANQTALTIIKDPELRFPACDVTEGGLPFINGTRGAYGMPNLAASLMAGDFRPCFLPTVSIQSTFGIVCAGDCIDFSAQASTDLDLEWVISDGRIIRDQQTSSICFDAAGTYSVQLRGITGKGDTVSSTRTLTVKPAMNFKLRSYSVVTDTIGALIKVPIVLNDTVSSIFEGEFSFDPQRLEYAGAFDEEGNRIDAGSLIDQGEIHIREQVTRDSIVGYMFFNLYWEDTLCRSIRLNTSRLVSASVQCLLNDAQYDLCLSSACGTQMLSQYLRTSKIVTSISPNPAASSVEIRASHDIENARIALFDMNGREMMRYTASLKAEVPETLDVSQLSNGVYFMSIQSSTGAARETIVIQR